MIKAKNIKKNSSNNSEKRQNTQYFKTDFNSYIKPYI